MNRPIKALSHTILVQIISIYVYKCTAVVNYGDSHRGLSSIKEINAKGKFHGGFPQN